MRIPEEAIIPSDKITHYLLVQTGRNDKSKFLAQAGFTQENPEALRSAIQSLVEAVEAVEDRKNEYGTFYQGVWLWIDVESKEGTKQELPLTLEECKTWSPQSSTKLQTL